MTTTPTVTDAKVWSPDSLLHAAQEWEQAAGDVQTHVDGVIRGVDSTQDFWTGSAADAMRAAAPTVTSAGVRVAESLLEASIVARDGATRIGDARSVVMTLVEEAYRMRCTVADDGTVAPPATPPDDVVGDANGNLEVARWFMDAFAAGQSAEITAALKVLADTDADVAAQLDHAFAAPAAKTRPAGAAEWTVAPADIVAGWPVLSQDRIASQIAGLTPDQRQQLVSEFPQQVGNTDGIPWAMRIAANRLNIANAVVEQQKLLGVSDNDKLLAVIRRTFPGWAPGTSPPYSAPGRLWLSMNTDPEKRRLALASYDDEVNGHIDFYTGLLGQVPDASGQSATPIDRQVVAFDPARSSYIELTGNLNSANHIGVFVPGVNTTILGSSSNLDTTRRIVEAGRGDIAMLTYVGGPFPDADPWTQYPNAADPHYATDMAPRLVAFSEDVNRVADSMGRDVSVTFVGHSYGGSVLGTAEAQGLTADRTLYVAAAGAGVGVNDPDDWHNGNPGVVRYAMTAPGDWIETVQGIGFGLGPHGADVDEMSGVIRLETGDYADGRPLQGWNAHSDIVNEPSDAWDNMLAVIAGTEVTVDEP